MSINNYVEIECDSCGETAEMGNSFVEAKENAGKIGFISRKNEEDEWENLCQNCK